MMQILSTPAPPISARDAHPVVVRRSWWGRVKFRVRVAVFYDAIMRDFYEHPGAHVHKRGGRW